MLGYITYSVILGMIAHRTAIFCLSVDKALLTFTINPIAGT